MDTQKLHFLKHEFIKLLKPLSADAGGNWGVMNGQQMVEHFVDAVKNASGKLLLPVVNSGERLEKFREFLWSDSPFRENTRNPLMNEQPAPLRQPDMSAAVKKLTIELNYLFAVFENDPSYTTQNPFFGELDYAGNVQLLHKHAIHHLTQFGLIGN
ncbi:MAG: hypothetical protein WKF97_15290 [Chitinophagaceae bacterium]